MSHGRLESDTTPAIVEPVAKLAASSPVSGTPATGSRPRRKPLLAASSGRGLLISGLAVLAVLIVWAIVTQAGLIKPLFLPKLTSIAAAFGDAVAGRIDGAPLLDHVVASLTRVVSAFVLAALVGVPVGLAMGLVPWVRSMLDPFIEFYRPLPPLAYLPLVIIWFGIGETSKILLIFLACFAPVTLAARAGVLAASSDQINAARSLGANARQLVTHVILPAAMPDILVGLRIGMGVGWTTLVAAEMVAASTGIGQMVLNASNFLRTDIVMMGIFVIGVFAMLFEFAMRWLERRLVPWRGKV